MDKNGARHQAWKDGLPQDQLEMIQRTDGMPPEMAVQYMWVDLDSKIAELRRPLWKQAATPAAVIGAYIAALLGLDPRSIGG